MSNPIVFDLVTTNKCNLGCKYCIENEYTNYHCEQQETKYSTDDVISFINKISSTNFLNNTGFDSVSLNYWGGEPTLQLDDIKEITNNYLNSNNVSFFISTNGYKIKEFLKYINNDKIKNKITIDRPFFYTQISFDGRPINNIKRLNLNDQDVTNFVLKNVEYMQKNNIKYAIKSTVTLDTLEYLYDAYNDIINVLKCPNYFPTIDYRTLMYNETFDIKPYLDVLHKNLILIAKNEINYMKKTRQQSRFAWFNYNNATCSAGEKLFAIDITGNIYKCHGCLSSLNKEDHIIGNIKDSDILETLKIKINEYSTNKKIIKDKCVECDAVYCLKCNSAKYSASTKDEYYDRWFDLTAQPILCELYKFISRYTRAVNVKVSE